MIFIKRNKAIIITTIILSLIGIVMIYSSSYIWASFKYGNAYKYFISQFCFLIIGIFMMFVFSKIDYNLYKKHSNKFLLVCFILLILVLIPGIGSVRNGSRSWFGILGFGFQPSEITKLSLTIFTSKYLSNNDRLKRNTFKFIVPLFLVIMLFFGLIMLEPDFGTGMVIVCSLIGLIFISGADFSIFIKLGVLGVIGIVILILIAPYRMDRITSFLDPWSDPLGSGFQMIQSLYAIGPGGLLGFGFLGSRQKHFYLPEPQTDFIFSIISEELGFLGVLIVVSLLATILISGFKIAYKCDDLFGKYLAFGIIFQIAFQACLNLMVVIGLIPVTGVTLPFLSYGGSSLLITLCSIGVVLNISRYNK